MEFVRKTIRVGNSAGVILPKHLLGSEVKVTVINKPINLKKEVLKILEQYFSDIRGVYITNEKPAEILTISTNIKKIIKNENLKVSIVPLRIVKKDLNKPKLKTKLFRAKTILNKSLLLDLQQEIKKLT